MIFEKVHLFPLQTGLTQRLFHRDLRRRKPERVSPVMQAKSIRGAGGGCDPHLRVRKILRQQIRPRQDQGGRAVCIGSRVEHIERVIDQFGLVIGFQADGLAEHGILVASRVGMGSQCKACQSIHRHIELVYVTACQHGRLGSRSQALDGLEVAISHRCQCRFHFRTNHVGKLFHTHHHRHIHQATRHGHITLAQRCATGSPARLDGFSLDPGSLLQGVLIHPITQVQPAKIGQHRAQVGLVRKGCAKHVTDEKCLRPQPSGIFNGRQNDFHRQ